jgi:uncharacterized protein
MTDFYHQGMREVQERMDSVRLADRLRETIVHEAFNADDRAFIASASMVFVATASADGRPDCSYKGGVPGFMRVLDDTTMAVPFYDGNGQYRTLGNITANPAVGLLFVDFNGRNRLRVNGDATVVTPNDDPAFVASFEGAEAVVVLRLHHAFPNCPRYIHDVSTDTFSEYAPAPGHVPPTPEWKTRPQFEPYLPKR